MRYGDTVAVTPKGFRIPAKELEPLGIFPKSKCWGLLVQGRRSPQSTLESGERRQRPHLVLSAIDPDLWPISFFLQMRLRNRPGVLAAALRDLREAEVNLLSVECSQSGYNRSSLNAMCAFDDLNDWQKIAGDDFRQLENEVSEDKADAELDQIRIGAFSRIGQRVLAALVGLWVQTRLKERDLYDRFLQWKTQTGGSLSAFEKVHPRERPVYLAPTIVEQGAQPWFLDFSYPTFDIAKWLSTEVTANERLLLKDVERFFERMKQEKQDRTSSRPTAAAASANQHRSCVDWLATVLERTFERHWTEPVALRALLPLAYARVWTVQPYRPIRFIYDEGYLVAEGDNAKYFNDEICGKRGRRPRLASGTFDHADRFLRLRFLRARESGQALRVTVRYDLTSEPGKKTQRSSRGLLAEVCSACAPQFQLLRVTNSLERTSERGHKHYRKGYAEIGRLELLALPQAENRRTREELETDIRARLLNWAADVAIDLSNLKVNAQPSPIREVFISHSFSAKRLDDIKELIRDAALEQGLALRFWEGYSKEATEEVNSAIEQAEGFLQILSAIDDDDKHGKQGKRGKRYGRPWLQFEYGIALALKKPRIRLIDSEIGSEERKRLVAMDSDRHPISFSSGWGRKALSKVFRRAFDELAERIEDG